MCGIAGFVTRRRQGVPRELVARTVDLLAHRGPDDSGILSVTDRETYAGRDVSRHLDNARLALIHRRLSILDLSPAGWQPMSSTDGRWHLVFNGEIYNYLELRTELEQLGCRFRSHTDTEVLLQALIAWGSAALPRFIGMFAFALFDRQENRLLLARDCFGIKPLFYANTDDNFGFASEIKVLLEMPGVSRRVNAERLMWYLRYGITDHGVQTMFDDVNQVPPAHYLSFDLATFRLEELTRYWQPEIRETIDVSFDEATTTVRDLFLKNIELHLRSDVPLGMALSGGIDSSSVVMSARKVLGRGADLHTFSYIASDTILSEERWVDLVNRASAATPHKVYASPRSLPDEMDSFVSTHDEPVGSTSVFAQDHVFRAAQEAGIKVMLDGQGADELLGGYRVSVGARLASLLRSGQLFKALNFGVGCSKRPGLGCLGILLSGADFLVPNRLQSLARRLVGRDLLPTSINEEWFRKQNVSPSLLNRPERGDLLREHLLNLVETIILPKLLRYEDRNSMAASIESRVPFLTPPFASYLLSLPNEYIISPRGTTKSVFRAAMRGIVPDEILDRRDKIGFETPELRWLISSRQWVDSLLDSDAAKCIPALNLPAARDEWKRIADGRQRFDFRVWRWLNLIVWTRRYEVDYSINPSQTALPFTRNPRAA